MRLVGIGSALLVNMAIIGAVVAIALLLKEPLVLLALFALQELPFQILPDGNGEGQSVGSGEYDGQTEAFGFVPQE